MKKILLICAVFLGVVHSSLAQYKGEIEVYKYGNFTLHSYTPARKPLPDVSFIIEGADGFIVLEQPSLQEGIAEFKDYLSTLNKPVVKVVSSYHTNNMNEWEPSLLVTIEGMPEFANSRSNGDANKVVPANIATIPADSKQTWIGTEFKFIPALKSSPFPAADVIIAGKVYYAHSAPSIGHPRRINSKDAVEQQLAYFKGLKNSGCELFIGSHGSIARMNAIDFQIAYFEKMKEVLGTATSKEEFINHMKASFYGLGGENNLTANADNLYK